MKAINYLFFGIYNSYYKDGNYKRDIPWYTVMMIFTFTFWCNASFILYLFNLPNQGYPLSRIGGFVLLVLCIALSYFLFIWRKRYDSIYNQYSQLDKGKRIINKIVSWIYFTVSILLFVLPAIQRMIDK